MPGRFVLHVIPFSHFNEKAMWVLDLKGIPYDLKPLLNPTDRSEIKRVTGGKSLTTPVLIEPDGRVLADSTDIALRAEELRPDPVLIPAEEPLRSECLLLEDWADEALGIHTRRWLFGHLLLRDPERGKGFLLGGRPAWQRPLLWPLARRKLSQAFQLSPRTVAASEALLRRELLLLRDRLASRRWLVGERPSLADLSVAALLGPLVVAGGWREDPELRAVFAWREALLEACGRRRLLTDPIPPEEERARRGAQARERLSALAAATSAS